jgi:hypothetical protein
MRDDANLNPDVGLGGPGHKSAETRIKIKIALVAAALILRVSEALFSSGGDIRSEVAARMMPSD